ncbi:MAG: response regulator, partial [Pseudolabrys sp.]|nr:response regulator [Pseudolabrys sp.]
QGLMEGVPPRVGLYRLFHAIWQSGAEHYDDTVEAGGQTGGQAGGKTPESRLKSLSASKRAALLLTAVEAFSLEEAAFIIDEAPEEVEAAILGAQKTIDSQLASKVLIIEDEPIIAMDLENLVTELGHKVVAVAATKDDAVAKAKSERPGLVLADINLGEGGSGIDAVSEILSSFDIPVIFITAYPERFLTGERPEPAFLIAKPFQPSTVSAVLSQALFFERNAKRRERRAS